VRPSPTTTGSSSSVAAPCHVEIAVPRYERKLRKPTAALAAIVHHAHGSRFASGRAMSHAYNVATAKCAAERHPVVEHEVDDRPPSCRASSAAVIRATPWREERPGQRLCDREQPDAASAAVPRRRKPAPIRWRRYVLSTVSKNRRRRAGVKPPECRCLTATGGVPTAGSLC
jgi:hypothetical protein